VSEENQHAQPPAASESEMEENFRTLLSPFGSEPHRRARQRAINFLLAHADESHPRLLAALRANPTALDAPSIIEVLPLFGREESVPLLEEIMSRGDEYASRSAGVALGQHPSPSALESLLRGLESHSNETLIAAADGLAARGDGSACEALRKLVRHHDAAVRYHVVRAAGKLGCLGPDELAALAETDPDADVRALAESLERP